MDIVLVCFNKFFLCPFAASESRAKTNIWHGFKALDISVQNTAAVCVGLWKEITNWEPVMAIDVPLCTGKGGVYTVVNSLTFV